MDFCTNSGLELIVGPMFAGKTTELMRRLNLYNEMRMRVLYINSSLDTRDDLFSTHNATLKKNNNIVCVKTDRIGDITDTIKDYDIIGIDEGHFFSDLYQNVRLIVDEMGKKVIISGLDGDYRREQFGDIVRLVPLCDSITKYRPFCELCHNDGRIVPAIFTHRHCNNNDTVDVGGKEKYYPTCRSCYLKPKDLST